MSPDARSRSVDASVRGVQSHLRRRVLLTALVWGGALLALLLLLALGLGGGGWARNRWAPLVLDLMALGGVVGGILAVRSIVRIWLAEREVTRAMERSAALPNGSVQGALELGRRVPEGVSAPLAVAAQRGVAGRLSAPPRSLAGSLEEEVLGWLRLGSGALVLLGGAVILAATLLPARSAAAWGGLLRPVSLLVTPALPRLVVTPGNTEVLRGSPLDIQVRAEGREEVTLHWSSPGEVPGLRTEMVVQSGAVFRFDAVTAPLTYWATTPDGARTAQFTVTPVDPLFLSQVTLELLFPPHTGRESEELSGEIPPLTLPAGTRIQVTGQGSRDLSGAAVDHVDGGPGGMAFEVDGNRFTGGWVPRRGGSYRWTLRDLAGGAPGVEPAPLDLQVVPDSIPFIRIAFPGQDTVLSAGYRQALVVEARDDYGVSGVEIVAWRVPAGGEEEEPRIQRMEVGGTRGVLVRPTLDMSRWGLLPGDVVRYYARAVDNAPSRQEGRSREFVLRVPGAGELRDETRDRLEDAAARLEEIAAQAEEQTARNQDLQRQAEAGRSGATPSRGGDTRQDPMDFAQREEMRRAMEEQAGLASSVDSLAAELARMEEGLREAGLLDPELRKDLQELEGLLDEIASPEVRERLQEMNRALQQNSSREIQDSFRQMTEAQEEFRDRLEESLQQFRRAAAEQDLRATTSEAQELARRQEAVSDAMERGDDVPLRAEQQEQLSADAQALAERMERLQERLEQAGEPEAAQGARNAGEMAREAQQAMEQASQQARAGENQRASQQGQEAAEALQQAVQELRDGQREMQEEMQGALVDALRRTAEDALALSRRQGEIRERMPGASAEQRRELQADEQALMQGLNNLAQNLSLSSQGSPEVDRQVSTSMGRAGQAMQQTMDALGGQGGRTPSSMAGAEQAMAALNEVARLSMENARRIEEGGGEGEAGEMSLQEQLEQLAQEQGQVNAESGQMMPLQLSGESLQGQMEQIAQGQDAIAGELGSLANQPGANDQTLGDLEALAQEAAALARELAGGRLEAETQRRQERLFQRLLDAGRSLEKEEEESEEREGETAGEVQRVPIQALDASATGLRFAPPGSAELQRLPPAQRQLVLDYFERLNRLPPATSGGASPPGGGR